MSTILELANLKDLDALLESRKTRTGDVVVRPLAPTAV